jgi:hypothetical protein
VLKNFASIPFSGSASLIRISCSIPQIHFVKIVSGAFSDAMAGFSPKAPTLNFGP